MEPFKNVFSPQLVECFAFHLGKHVKGFEHNRFIDAIIPELVRLELKQRAQLIAEHIHAQLPDDHDERAQIMLAMLHNDPVDVGDGNSDNNGIRGWGILPLNLIICEHGLADFERSLLLLKEMTKRHTSEFGIRAFLINDQKRALTMMAQWTNDPSKHVRRLVSEGTRPRLPWAEQLPGLIKDPLPLIPLLTKLRDDKQEYVRRSVANSLNDIAKDHPDLVARLAHDWIKGGDANRKKLLKHACRTLIKDGNEAALAAFGIQPAQIKLDAFKIDNKTLHLGEKLNFSAEIVSTGKQDQKLIIDIVCHFRKANGSLSRKVFKGTAITLKAGQTHTFKRAHRVKLVTTRRYYAGEQGLSLKINGKEVGFETFDLVIVEGRH